MEVVIYSNRFHPPWNNAGSVITYSLFKSLAYLRKSNIIEDFKVLSSINKYWIHRAKGSEILKWFNMLKHHRNIKYISQRDLIGELLLFKQYRKYFNFNKKSVLHLVSSNIAFIIPLIAENRSNNLYVIRHIYTPPTSSINKLATRMLYSYILKDLNNVVVAFTSKSLKASWNLHKSLKSTLIPPAIDTRIFNPYAKVSSSPKLTNYMDLKNYDLILLHLGSLEPHRFPIFKYLKAISYLKYKMHLNPLLIAIGRGYIQDIKHHEYYSEYIKKFNCDILNNVFITIKDLDIEEKISLFSLSTLLLLLASNENTMLRIPASDPPLTLLEAIATGLPVITTYNLDYVEYGNYESWFVKVDWTITPLELAKIIYNTNKRINDVASTKITMTMYKFIDTFYSIKSLAHRLRIIYENILKH